MTIILVPVQAATTERIRVSREIRQIETESRNARGLVGIVQEQRDHHNDALRNDVFRLLRTDLDRLRTVLSSLAIGARGTTDIWIPTDLPLNRGVRGTDSHVIHVVTLYLNCTLLRED